MKKKKFIRQTAESGKGKFRQKEKEISEISVILSPKKAEKYRQNAKISNTLQQVRLQR